MEFINKEQYDYPPQAARSFVYIVKIIEIVYLLKLAELKVVINRLFYSFFWTAPASPDPSGWY